MSEQKQYAERDVCQLDELGNYFSRHMLALTVEDLRSKSDIAAELAWRDAEIERLRTELSELRSKVDGLCEDEGCPHSGIEHVCINSKAGAQVVPVAKVTSVYDVHVTAIMNNGAQLLPGDVLYTDSDYLQDTPAQAVSLTTPTPSVSCVPDVLFDGYSVMQELTPQAKRTTSSEQVSWVLDAVVRLIRKQKP